MTVKINPHESPPEKVSKLTKIAIRTAFRGAGGLIVSRRWISDGRCAMQREIVPESLLQWMPESFEDSTRDVWRDDESRQCRALKEVIGITASFKAGTTISSEGEVDSLLDRAVQDLRDGALKPAIPSEVVVHECQLFTVGADANPKPAWIHQQFLRLFENQTVWAGSPNSVFIREDGMALAMPSDVRLDNTLEARVIKAMKDWLGEQ